VNSAVRAASSAPHKLAAFLVLLWDMATEIKKPICTQLMKVSTAVQSHQIISLHHTNAMIHAAIFVKHTIMCLESQSWGMQCVIVAFSMSTFILNPNKKF
jgi:hypothetical protein